MDIMISENQLVCPIGVNKKYDISYCYGGKCALWFEERKCCAFLDIAKSLDCLNVINGLRKDD